MDPEEKEEQADKEKEIRMAFRLFIKAINDNSETDIRELIDSARKNFNESEFTQIINYNMANGLRRNTLMYASASENANLEIVKLLLNNGAAVNAVDSTGMTALMLAAERGHLQIVTLLLNNGANIYNKTTIGPPKNALEFAIEYGHPDVANVLDKWDETKAMFPLEKLGVLSGLDPSSFIDMKEYSRKGGKRKRTQKKRKRTQKKRKQTKRYRRKN